MGARTWFLLVVIIPAACAGQIGQTEAPVVEEPNAPPAGCAVDVEPSLIRQLNRREYTNTARDLLMLATGAVSAAVARLPADAIVAFDNNAETLAVSSLLTEERFRAAESLARAANLANLLPCTTGDAACAGDFIRRFGRRAFRRPPTPDEQDVLLAVFTRGRANGRSFDESVRLVIQAMLVAPQFLYRVETSVSPTGGLAKVDPWELASRLSYFIWASMPDEALFGAAERGQIDVPAEARRLMANPKAKANVATFHNYMFMVQKDGLDSVDTVETNLLGSVWTYTYRPALSEEMTRFFDYTFWNTDGRFDRLLLSDKVFINDTLATYYGGGLPMAGTALTPVAANTQRFGLLTQGGLMALLAGPDRTSPTNRGKFIREQLLCQVPPPPPPNVNTVIPAATQKAATVRQRMAQHRSDPSCAACHAFVDPVGFGLENYDALGRYRTSEKGVAVDASGEVTGLTAADGGALAGKFIGPTELSQRLAASQEYSTCMSTQWFRFAMGRAEGPRDVCALGKIQKAVNGFRDIPVAIASSDAFLHIQTQRAP